MKQKKLSYAKYGYMFCIPFTIAFLVFQFYPVLYTALIGFTGLKGLGKSITDPGMGIIWNDLFKNFKTVLTNGSFRTAFKNTWMIWGVNFIPQVLLALLFAAIFTSTRSKIKGQGFFKVVFYMPNIITAATIAILFASFFGYPKGPVNDLFMRFGISKDPIFFLQSKTTARGVVAFIQFWMWYGYSMIVFISGILGISPDIFEAAEVDGATRFQQFIHVTLPNLRTIMLFSLVTSLIGGLQMFDIPQLFIAKSGPDNATLTTSCFIYNQAFAGSYMYNRAAAASMLMFLIICICSAILFYLMRDKDEAALNKIVRKQEKEFRKKMRLEKKGGKA